MDFTANGVAMGTNGSELRLAQPGSVRATAKVACLLPPAPLTADAPDPTRRPFWTPEHARVAGSRDVTVELIRNGRPVASSVRATACCATSFDARVDRSAWMALRIMGSAHTNPIFVVVGGRPIRASRKSAEWCLQAVDQCWSQKMRRISGRERDAAQRAYEQARVRYRQIVSESDVD
jgi:hypothetical protein